MQSSNRICDNFQFPAILRQKKKVRTYLFYETFNPSSIVTFYNIFCCNIVITFYVAIFLRMDILTLLQLYNNVVATFHNMYRILQCYSVMSIQRPCNPFILYANVYIYIMLHNNILPVSQEILWIFSGCCLKLLDSIYIGEYLYIFWISVG